MEDELNLSPEKNEIVFRIDSEPEEVLNLSKDGFTYKGVIIEDAGEAHKLFTEFMKNANIINSQ